MDDAGWLRLDAPFMANDLHGPADGPAWLLERGRHPLVFTAVHPVVHWRPGWGRKSAEARTGGLARLLAAGLGSSAATVLRAAGGPDANVDATHPFKAALAAGGLVGPGAVIIDLHGMTDRHPADVAIGRGPLPSPSTEVADAAVAAFREQGFVVDPDGGRCGLTGSGPGTVTAFAQHHGAAAVQVEIARRNRTFRTGVDGVERRQRLLAAFAAFAGLAAALARRSSPMPREALATLGRGDGPGAPLLRERDFRAAG